MEVKFELALPKSELNELARILDVAPQALAATLGQYATAAVREYTAMFLGQKVFRRGSDLLEYRLFLLIEEALGDRIPDEQRVSNLFQTTATESRSLIRSVMSKYQYQLKAAIEASLEEIVRAAKRRPGEDEYLVVVNSQNLVDQLNRTLAEIDGSLPLVVKQRESVSTYVIQPSSYEELKKKLA